MPCVISWLVFSPVLNQFDKTKNEMLKSHKNIQTIANNIIFVIDHGSLLKPKRIRTTFSDDQLQILNANFNLDPNPDGHDLERIAKQTGLSKRVTQVWFQNSRARQKKQSSNSGNVKRRPGMYLKTFVKNVS